MKFVWGLVFLGLSFALLVPAAKLTAEGKVSPWWLIAVYFLQTLGELCLSPVGLSAMTKLAPAKLAGLVMGIWFLGTALGNKLAGVVAAEFNAKSPQALDALLLAASPAGRRPDRAAPRARAVGPSPDRRNPALRWEST